MRSENPAGEEFWSPVEPAEEAGLVNDAAILTRHNAHIHVPPNFSAFSSCREAAELARSQGISMLGVSNYYDFAIYDSFEAECLAQGILPVYGLEVIGFEASWAKAGLRANDPKNPGKIYLCGKGLCRHHNPDPQAAAILTRLRLGDGERMERIAQLWNEALDNRGIDFRLDIQTIRHEVSQTSSVTPDTVHLQERHLARALADSLMDAQDWSGLERLGAGNSRDSVAIQNALRNEWLKTGKPAYVPETSLPVLDVLTLVKGLGGIPVYPILGDGMPGGTELEKDLPELFDRLKAWDIHHMEWIPTRNSPEYLEKSVRLAMDAGFRVSAGTEHNSPVMEPLLPSCKSSAEIPDDLRLEFAKGMLHFAALQGFGMQSRSLPHSQDAIRYGLGWARRAWNR